MFLGPKVPQAQILFYFFQIWDSSDENGALLLKHFEFTPWCQKSQQLKFGLNLDRPVWSVGESHGESHGLFGADRRLCSSRGSLPHREASPQSKPRQPSGDI